MNILIVDDSTVVRKVFLKTLKLTNFSVAQVFEAGNGLEALTVMAEQEVDVIFLDINMPVMNGMEFMDRLRGLPEPIGKTPVVVVSTEGSNERIEKLEQHKIVAYLRKPVTPEQLAETLQRLEQEKSS